MLYPSNDDRSLFVAVPVNLENVDRDSVRQLLGCDRALNRC